MNMFSAAQIAADNDLRDVMDYPVPDPTVITIRITQSELQDMVDRMMESRWIEGEIENEVPITPAAVGHGIKEAIDRLVDDWLGSWNGDDFMGSDLSNALREEIRDYADKAALSVH